MKETGSNDLPGLKKKIKNKEY